LWTINKANYSHSFRCGWCNSINFLNHCNDNPITSLKILGKLVNSIPCISPFDSFTKLSLFVEFQSFHQLRQHKTKLDIIVRLTIGLGSILSYSTLIGGSFLAWEQWDGQLYPQWETMSKDVINIKYSSSFRPLSWCKIPPMRKKWINAYPITNSHDRDRDTYTKCQ